MAVFASHFTSLPPATEPGLELFPKTHQLHQPQDRRLQPVARHVALGWETPVVSRNRATMGYHGLPQIIQVMDAHDLLATHGDLGDPFSET